MPEKVLLGHSGSWAFGVKTFYQMERLKEKLLDKFLAFDTRALGSAVAKEKLEKEILKKVKKFGEEKETKGIRLVKK